MESFPMANVNPQGDGANLLPKVINVVAGPSQESSQVSSQMLQEGKFDNGQQKVVAMSSKDQEEYDRERYYLNQNGNT